MKDRANESIQNTGLALALANRRLDARARLRLASFLSRHLSVHARNM